jgi:hypothetical protein
LGAVGVAALAEVDGAGGSPPTAERDESVRATLGAAVTVRVSRGDDDSVRVSVSTGAGDQRTKELGDTSRSKVSAAVTELLEASGFAAVAAPTVRSGTPAGGATATRSPPPAAGASAATTPASDQVLLKDGTTIRGHVSKQSPGTFVTIEMADGAHTIPWERVKEVIVAPQFGF